MSHSPPHEPALPVVAEVGPAKSRPGLSERAVGLAFVAAVSLSMIGWLYLLLAALWGGVGWLMS